MTIEERAKKYCESYKDSYKGQAFQDFMAGAAEQRKIDTDKACKWFRAYLFEVCEESIGYAALTESLIDSLRKAMED